jgi:hypothetical protein
MVPLPNGWSKYLEKTNACLSLPPEEWKDPQVLGYLIHRFKKYTGRDFALTFSKSPTKSPELHFVKALQAMLTTSNGDIVKQYIDWCFDVKIIPKEIQIRSFALLNNNTFVNEFLHFRSKARKVTRATLLPVEWRSRAKEMDIEVETYGDIVFIKLAVERGEADISYRNYYNYLSENGLTNYMLEALNE